MSRIGNKAITIPAGVEVTIAAGNEVTVKGSKGTLTRQFNPALGIKVEENVLTVTRPKRRKACETAAWYNPCIAGKHGRKVCPKALQRNWNW